MNLLNFNQIPFDESVFRLFKKYAQNNSDLAKQSNYAFKIAAPLREKACIIFKIGKSLGITHKTLKQIAFVSELMTSTSLTIDDVFDKSLLRENKPSLYNKIGEERTYYTSEFMYGIMFKVLFSLSDDIKCRSIINNFIESYLNIQKGQYLTCSYKNKLKTLTPEFMDELAYLKVGSHTESSTSAPAYLTNNKQLINSFGLFGKYLGIALMHRNDISDFCWTKDEIGRDGFEDLFDSKPNLVLAYFLKNQTTNPVEKKIIISVWEGNNKNNISRIKIKNIINKSGSIDLARKHLEKICNKAKTSLDQIKDNKLKKDLFKIIAIVQNI